MQRTFTDQMLREITVEHPPRRIISLVPSQTELLHALGLGEEVVGITKFCVHPEAWYRNKTRVGGTKQAKLEKVAALEPDLIIGNKEENTREDIEILAAQFPVWMSDIHHLSDALGMIRSAGQLVGREAEGEGLAAEIERRFERLERELSDKAPIRTAYLIWRKPYMLAASDTFINAMLQQAGLANVFAHRSRYPEVSLEDLARANPQAILLSSEPYPFRERHLEEFSQACPQSRVQLVDGEMFSWYGSRSLEASGYFRGLRRELLGG